MVEPTAEAPPVLAEVIPARPDYRAETERMRVLADFLARPIHAHGGSEPDPDIVTAYNLATESALLAIRRLALGEPS